MSSGGTTDSQPSSSGSSSDKDILLIVASVSMALATVALILVVRIFERCLPDADRQETQRQLEKKTQRMKELIDKSSVLLTYSAWVEKAKIRLSTGSPKHGSSLPISTYITGVTRSLSRLDNSDLPVSIGSPSQPANPPRSRSGGSNPWCDDCAVCLTEFTNDESIRELQCSHIFHEECLHGWFIKSKRPVCPLCRFNLQEGRIDEHSDEAPAIPSSGSNRVAVETV